MIYQIVSVENEKTGLSSSLEKLKLLIVSQQTNQIAQR